MAAGRELPAPAVVIGTANVAAATRAMSAPLRLRMCFPLWILPGVKAESSEMSAQTAEP